MDQLRSQDYYKGAPQAGRIRLLSWNIERGIRAADVTQFIRQENPAVCLLQEVDLNARRTGRRDIGGAIALQLGYNMVFGTEWEELAQGSDESPAYQGQATLAKSPIRNARVLRFKTQSNAWKPAWWKPEWAVFQPRRGGRIALAAEIEWAGTTLATYNVHLESQVPEEGRRRQLQEVLADARRYPPEVPVVIAGDFNTRLKPTPLLSDLRQAQFRNAIGTDYVNTKRDGSGSQDWVFVRGPVQVSDAKVRTEQRASDHFPITLEVSLAK